MPSNKNLTAEAEKLAEEIGVTVATEGLDNKALGELVAKLRAQKEGTAPPPPTTGAKDADADAADPVPRVAEGKSLVTRRGILGPEEGVKPEDFAGGVETLKRFYKSGYIVIE